MRALAVRRSRPALLLLGLSSRGLTCRAFGLGGRPTAIASTRLRSLSGGDSLCFGRRRWNRTALDNCNTGRQRVGHVCLRSTAASTTEGASSAQSAADAPTCKWQFTHPNRGEEYTTNNGRIRNLLVCGDGDLSYAAAVSSELKGMGIELVATVLEEEDVHNDVYQYSKANTETIASAGHAPLFGVDATALSTLFGDASFDRIQFNFPHWRGKANNRYNRQLLSEFLQSAATVLSPRGEIHVALCDGQGGSSAATLEEWRGSWTASLFAAEHGLLLTRTFPYEADYNLSAFRGKDRGFALGKNPAMHVFVRPDGEVIVPREIQLCCRHELHIVLPDDEGASAACGLDQILEGDAIETIVQSTCVPEGVRVEVPSRQILTIQEGDGSTARIAVFLVVYCGERHPVTRADADRWRELAETEVEKHVPLRENRRGRTVSRPFPYPALHPEIKYRT